LILLHYVIESLFSFTFWYLSDVTVVAGGVCHILACPV